MILDRYRLLVLVSALMLWGISGQSDGQQEQIMTFNETQEPQSLNPINTQFAVDARFSDLIFDKLVGYNEFMKPEAHLLESLEPTEISEDKLKHTFKLREGVMWHPLREGRDVVIPAQELTAEDVVFTYKVITDNRSETDKRPFFDYIQDVVATDRYHVQFVLSQPMDDIRGFLFFPVIPKYIFGQHVPEYLTVLDDFGTKQVVGTGPYMFLLWVQNKGIALFRNKNYFKGWPSLIEEGSSYIDRIQMRIQKDENASKENLLAGGSQLLPLVNPVHYSELRNNATVRLQNYNPRSIVYFALNNEHSYLDKAKFRVGLTHAINRKRMLDRIYGASIAQDAKIKVLSGPYPAGEGNPDLPPREYDLELARKLISEVEGVSFENGKLMVMENGMKTPFVIRLRVAETQEDKRRICEFFQDDLSQLGIEVKMEFMPRSNWRKEVAEKRDYDATLVQMAFRPTASIVEELFSKAATAKGRNNLTMYTNDRVEQLLVANRTTNDPQVKTENKRKLHFIFWQDCPGIFLFSSPNYAAYRIDQLGGVDIHPFDFFAFITNWYFLPGSSDLFGF